MLCVVFHHSDENGSLAQSTLLRPLRFTPCMQLHLSVGSSETRVIFRCRGGFPLRVFVVCFGACVRICSSGVIACTRNGLWIVTRSRELHGHARVDIGIFHSSL